MKKDPKAKQQKEDDDELVIDCNPDDVEFGEELPGTDKQSKKNREKNRDYSPDDFE